MAGSAMRAMAHRAAEEDTFHAESRFAKENMTQHTWAGALAPLDASAGGIIHSESRLPKEDVTQKFRCRRPRRPVQIGSNTLAVPARGRRVFRPHVH